MKKIGVLFFLIVLISQVFSIGQAFEKLRNMDVESVAMGFTKNYGFNYPTSTKFEIEGLYSELFGLGLIYNSEKIRFFLPRVNFSLGTESFWDKDPFDTIGYSEKSTLLGANCKVFNNLSLGASLKNEKYQLEGKSIGNGWVTAFEIGIGPRTCKYGNYNIGIRTENAFRKFDTGREEKKPLGAALNFGFKNSLITLAMNINKDEIQLGTEYCVSKNFKLRAGLNGKEPTFGLGVKLNRLDFNYAYWLSEAGATQLLGTAYSF